MAAIARVEIEGYRGISAPLAVSLAVPDGSRPGSGLTILVGPNGSGKSTVIEALHFLQSTDIKPKLARAQRNSRTNGRVTINYVSTSGRRLTLATSAYSGGGLNWTGLDDWDVAAGTVFGVPSRRAIEEYFGAISSAPAYEREQWIRSTAEIDFRSALRNFGPRLAQAEANRGAFDSLFAQIIRPVPSWHLDADPQRGAEFVQFYSDGSPHTIEGVGSGIAALFFLVDALYDSEPGDTILIDEPELSLHPMTQRRLMKVLENYSITRQIIYATQSPFLISWLAVRAGGEIVRLARDLDPPRAAQLTASTRSALDALLSDRNHPHILGLDARAAFFLDDSVILVEGPDDVQLYPLVANELHQTVSGDFFGWGVGGAEKMRVVAALLRDLGFRNVVGVVDRGKEEVASQLRSEFPNYSFFVLPAADIRTKSAKKAGDKVLGVLDEKHQVRAEFAELMSALFNEVNAALKNQRAP
jgi:hypothetical protein